MAKLPSYDTSGIPRGYGVIIVNKFVGGKCLVNGNQVDLTRFGAEEEVGNLIHLFNSLGLIPIVKQELTKNEVICGLQGLAKSSELEKHSMIAVAISSHGGEVGLYGVDLLEGKKVEECAITTKEIQSILNSTNCPLLKGKPKLIFLNGCRGSEKERVRIPDGRGEDNSDFLTVYSTVHGHISLRDRYTGSIFIKELCDTLLKYNGTDILDLITHVSREVMDKSYRTEEIDDEIVTLTETPEAVPCLTKTLCLTRVDKKP